MNPTQPRARNHLRAIAFAVVLLLITGLILGLFRDAGAFEMTFSERPARIDDTGVFVLDVRIERGQRVPIRSLDAVLEQAGAEAATKRGALPTGTATCALAPVPGFECPRDAPFLPEANTPAVTRIKFLSARTDPSPGPTLGYADIYGSGEIAGTTTGYGIDPQAGHGVRVGGPAAFHEGIGFGYGAATTALRLRFEVVVRACTTDALAPGTHFLTLVANTGLSDPADKLSSPYAPFTVQCDGATNSTSPGQAPNAVPATPRNGAAATYRISVPDAPAGRILPVLVPDAILRGADLLPRERLQNAEIYLHRWTAPPAGLPSPNSPKVPAYLQIEHESGRGILQAATLHLRLEPAAVDNPNRLLVLQHVGDAWQFSGRVPLLLGDDGRFSGTATSSCCAPLSLAFDAKPPTADPQVPEGALQGVLDIPTRAADELGVAFVDLLVDGKSHSQASAPGFVARLDTRQFPNGQHQIEVLVEDWSGRTSRATFARDFQNP